MCLVFNTSLFYCYVLFFVGLGIKPRALQVLGKPSSAESHP